MAFRRNNTWTTVAIGAVLTLGSLSTANAQAPAGAAPAGHRRRVAGQGEVGRNRRRRTGPRRTPRTCAPCSSTGPGTWACCEASTSTN